MIPLHTAEQIAEIAVNSLLQIARKFGGKDVFFIFEGDFVLKTNGPATKKRFEDRKKAFVSGDWASALTFPDCVVRLVIPSLLTKAVTFLSSSDVHIV